MSRSRHITSEIVADSIGPEGNRITSFVVQIPRIVLAEFNTHRMLSRNSASSRAIPFKTKIESMFEGANASLFMPLAWQKDHKGMQGSEYFAGIDVETLDNKWIELGEILREYAEWFSAFGVTKQICNRVLELHSHQTIIVTASEWQNFFALRAHNAAEIHIQKLAYKMLESYNSSTPKILKEGEWHIPFGDQLDENRLIEYLQKESVASDEGIQELKIKIATARCARVSYLNYEGTDDYEKDVKLHDQLIGPPFHASPFEHCARTMTYSEYLGHHLSQGKNDPFDGDVKHYFGVCGNFKGFIQYRKMFKEENATDNRVI